MTLPDPETNYPARRSLWGSNPLLWVVAIAAMLLLGAIAFTLGR